MKKLFTLLLISLAACSFKSNAQSNCSADFTFTISGFAATFHPVTIGDSINTHHSWTFGDGGSSTAASPLHNYGTYGSFTVKHILNYYSNGVIVCRDTVTKVVLIQFQCNLVADFTWQSDSLNNSTIHFHNTSVPLEASDSITWSFGDGTYSFDVSPTHTYTAPGAYNVCLTVKKNNSPPGGTSCVRTTCHTIGITTSCNLQAAFTWHADSLNALHIFFTNTSVPLHTTDSVSWTFGDGTSSNQFNPDHTYPQAGNYVVCLRVQQRESNGGLTSCIRTICNTVVVQTSCNTQAAFTWHADSLNSQKIYFTNTSAGVSLTDSIQWTFGDGSSSNVLNPVHIYAQAGTYNVCLIIRARNAAGALTGCVRYICHSVVVQSSCNLQASFYSYRDSTIANLYTWHFQNTSTPVATNDSIRWSFGDGTYSNVRSPNHTYTTAGTYNVCLRMIQRTSSGALTNCVSEVCHPVVITAECNLQVGFNWHADSANSQKIHFTNTSVPLSPTDSIRWTFGDLSTSNAVNPDHIYANPGTYSVCLMVMKRNANGGLTGCSRYLCLTVVVTQACNLVADFIWHADSLNTQKIWFTNTSTPLNTTDSIRWTFGDGTTSNLFNPDHTYANAGTYTVCLRVQKRNNAPGTAPCVREICKVVVVTASACNFQPNYTWRADSLNSRRIIFTNTTSVPVTTATATWSFGDGTTATSWNAVHEYAQPGRYSVCLRIELNPNCVRYKCDSIVVAPQAPPCSQLGNFTFVRSTADAQTYSFIPAYQNSADQYLWTFGDGTSSNAMLATHHYTQPGSYTVCLTVVHNNTCAGTSCKTISVAPQINCDSIHVTYTYQHDAYVPNKIYFYAISNFPILDETWTITRIPASSAAPVTIHQNNPVYVFQDTGNYRVCLRAITLGGCIKEYCSTVYIAQVAPATQCTLQAYPNPASSQVSVNVLLTAPEMIHVYVYNMLNVLVKTKDQQGTTGNNVVTLNISDLVAGSYHIKVVYGNKICYSQFQKL